MRGREKGVERCSQKRHKGKPADDRGQDRMKPGWEKVGRDKKLMHDEGASGRWRGLEHQDAERAPQPASSRDLAGGWAAADQPRGELLAREVEGDGRPDRQAEEGERPGRRPALKSRNSVFGDNP